MARERARILWRAAELIDQNIDQLVEIERLNNGMSRLLARNIIAAGAEMFRYYAGWSTKIHGQSTDVLAGEARVVPALNIMFTP